MNTNIVDPFIRELIENEPSLHWFGFTIERASEGVARVCAQVGSQQVNGHAIAHGGVIFALADQAFAMAANTVMPNAATADAQIQFLAPSTVGDKLIAEAKVSYIDSKRAVVDVTVRSQSQAIALFRGTARPTKRAGAPIV